MKRIELKNGDFVEIESLGRAHGIRIGLYDKMGYAKELKYYTDDEVLKMLGFLSQRNNNRRNRQNITRAISRSTTPRQSLTKKQIMCLVFIVRNK